MALHQQPCDFKNNFEPFNSSLTSTLYFYKNLSLWRFRFPNYLIPIKPLSLI